MEYVYYILVTLAITALCLYLVRLPGQKRLKQNQLALAERARKIRKKQHQERAARDNSPLPTHKAVLQRELSKVPTPWGWPGYEGASSQRPVSAMKVEEVHGVSESIHRWVNHLISEKQTVDDNEYVLKRDASLRALLEDRFGRPSKMSEIKYRKTKAPLLRDPSAPHDQMDNFPSGKTASIEEKLDRQPSKPSVSQQSYPKRKTVGLDNLKKPWGW
jgi:hypothetical protein